MRIVIIIFLVLNYSCLYNNKHKKHDKINPTGLKNDFKILRQTLEEAHPGLYWYTDKTLMDNHFDSVYALLDQHMTRVDFFKILLPLVADIKCLHTNLRLPNDLGKSAFQLTKLLPFDFFCREEKIYIANDYNNTGQTGAEILSINNNSSKKILKALLKSLPADGCNETYKYHLLNQGALREGYALYFDQSDFFVIEAFDSSNMKPIMFTVKAKSPRDIPAVKNNPSQQPVYLKFQKNINTVTLTINTFEINTKKFIEIISAMFQKIKEKNIQHLIIDLRENGGGNNDNIPELFSFMAYKPFLHLKRAEMNAGSFTYLRHFKKPDAFKNLYGVDEHNGKYLMDYRYAGTTYKQPVKAFSYIGEVIILTSGHTVSAASEFAALARYQKRATIIGEETGGCYYGSTGGNYINLMLPASKLEIRIPTIRIFTAVKEDFAHQPKGRGTLPDYVVSPGIDDVLQNKDVQLEMALNFIRKKNNRANQPKK